MSADLDKRLLLANTQQRLQCPLITVYLNAQAAKARGTIIPDTRARAAVALADAREPSDDECKL